MRKLSLFSGIGGIDLAAHWAGMETVAFCEREPFPQKVLQKHWPDVPIYDDVCTLTAERLKEDGIIGDGRTIDIISAGYPCQPFSNAGKRRGKEDDRHLWPEVARILHEVRPRWFLGENVAGHITLGLDEVLDDLEGLGYTAQAFVIPASSVYAGHRRDRVFIVGHTSSQGFQERGQSRWSESEEEAGTGLVTEFERSGETMAYTEINTEGRLSIREGTENARPACSGENVAHTSCKRCGETRGDQFTGPEKWTPGSSEIMAHSSSIGQQGPGEHFESIHSKTDCEREAIESLNGGERRYVAHTDSKPGLQAGSPVSAIGSVRESRDDACRCSRTQSTGTSGGAAQSQMGGSADELSDGLDGRGIGTLDGLIDFIHSYPQPALMGMPQYDWEPPRVATGVKDRTGRLKALGNAVNPLQVYPIMAAIKAINDEITD